MLTKFVSIAALAVVLAACTATEGRIAGGAAGAGAGALIAGPIGAVAGGAVGVIAGPTVTGSLQNR